MKGKELLKNKRKRNINLEEELNIDKEMKIEVTKNDNNIEILDIFKEYKTLREIKEETFNKFNNLDKEKIKDNKILLDLGSNCDVIEEINCTIINNDLEKLKKSTKSAKTLVISDFIILFQKLKRLIIIINLNIIYLQIKELKY